MQDPSGLVPPGLNGHDILIWLAISQTVIFLTAITTLTFNYLRDGRNRRWQEEDRRLQQVETVNTAKTLSTQQTETARQLADQQATTAKELVAHTSLTAASLRELTLQKMHGLELDLLRITQELAETKRAAGAAYQEANHVNLKISAYNQRLLETRGDAAGLEPPLIPLPIPLPLPDPPRAS